MVNKYVALSVLFALLPIAFSVQFLLSPSYSNYIPSNSYVRVTAIPNTTYSIYYISPNGDKNLVYSGSSGDYVNLPSGSYLINSSSGSEYHFKATNYWVGAFTPFFVPSMWIVVFFVVIFILGRVV